jgi:hypothetical protein
MEVRAERFERTLLDARSQPVPRAGGFSNYVIYDDINLPDRAGGLVFAVVRLL